MSHEIVFKYKDKQIFRVKDSVHSIHYMIYFYYIIIQISIKTRDNYKYEDVMNYISGNMSNNSLKFSIVEFTAAMSNIYNNLNTLEYRNFLIVNGTSIQNLFTDVINCYENHFNTPHEKTSLFEHLTNLDYNLTTKEIKVLDCKLQEILNNHSETVSLINSMKNKIDIIQLWPSDEDAIYKDLYPDIFGKFITDKIDSIPAKHESVSFSKEDGVEVKNVLLEITSEHCNIVHVNVLKIIHNIKNYKGLYLTLSMFSTMKEMLHIDIFMRLSLVLIAKFVIEEEDVSITNIELNNKIKKLVENTIGNFNDFDFIKTRDFISNNSELFDTFNKDIGELLSNILLNLVSTTQNNFSVSAS